MYVYCIGLLSAVDFLILTHEMSTISANWTAPFTLDVDSTNPDITYCVNVVNSTSSETLHRRCGITETHFTYPTPDNRQCPALLFTVTPVNRVGNGASRTVSFLSALLSGMPKVVS